MYIDINLRYRDDSPVPKEYKLIEHLSRENNRDYLVKGNDNPEFPYLSDIEPNDPSAFGSQHMDGIIQELLRVRKEVTDPEDRAHIDDIIRLAQKCKEMPDTVLTFSGFFIPINT